jgi:predicted transcriptional regulator
MTGMSRGLTLHPKAYLISKRNVKAGLITRTKILLALEEGRKIASAVASETALSYDCVAYHLNSMRKDRLVDRIAEKRPFTWGLTPFGQQKLPTEPSAEA